MAGRCSGSTSPDHTGTPVLVYGQTEVTRDLYAAREAAGGRIEFEVADVAIHGADSDAPHLTYRGTARRSGSTATSSPAATAFTASAGGRSRPRRAQRLREGLSLRLARHLSARPRRSHHELIYANSPRGFALCSMRSDHLSRYYIQCSLSDAPGDWTDVAFWDELRRRIPAEFAEQLVTGPSIEKSIAPLRSFVTEPMRWGRLFLCGDAAHIVPPTGAKGLNTAASDVHYLYHALRAFYETGSWTGIEAYSANALARVWKAERFSWWFSSLLHRYPDQSEFDLKMQTAELEFLRSNQAAQRAMAENYVGLPY